MAFVQPAIDAADFLTTRPAHQMSVLPESLLLHGTHLSAQGFGAFACHSEYPQQQTLTMCDSDERLHLSVWLQDGIQIQHGCRQRQVQKRDAVIGYLPGEQWQIDVDGHLHHVGLLLSPEQLSHLAGASGEAFLAYLQGAGYLQIRQAELAVLRSAIELDRVLLQQNSSQLLREAKSLDLLANVIDAVLAPSYTSIGQHDRRRLIMARELLLADLSRPPGILQLARASGLNSFRLKQGFRQLFGATVYEVYQQARMQMAWELLTSGEMNVTQAGHQIGYTNMSHFSHAFKAAFGVLPGEVKRQLRLPVMSAERRRRE